MRDRSAGLGTDSDITSWMFDKQFCYLSPLGPLRFSVLLPVR